MAIIKGKVTVQSGEGSEALAEGMIYLHIGVDRGTGGPRVQGTISPVVWSDDATKQAEYPAGSRLRVTFDDGRTLTVILTRRIFTGCGPEVLRFNAEDSQAAAQLT